MLSDEIWVGLLTLFSVLVGSLLQNFLSKKSTLNEFQIKLKEDAYSDFARSAAGVAVSQRMSDQTKELDYTILLADAKARITVCGSKEVVESLATFFKFKAHLADPESRRLFTNAIKAMREDLLSSNQRVQDNDINSLLYGGEE